LILRHIGPAIEKARDSTVMLDGFVYRLFGVVLLSCPRARFARGKGNEVHGCGPHRFGMQQGGNYG
jgi:hypothetical protein